METSYTLIFGIHPIQELLAAKRRQIYKIYTTNPAPKAFSTLRTKIPARVPIQAISREKLTELAGTADHQGVVAAVGHFPFRKQPFKPEQHPVVLLLDGIQDPRNLGALIRSASCTNTSGIIMPAKGSAPLSGAAVKASAGLSEHADIYQAPSSIAALLELKKAGYEIYLATLGGKDVRTITFTTPVCIVLGSEGSGISSALLAHGTAITLPQRIPTISYNASVAGGILLFMINSALHKI